MSKQVKTQSKTLVLYTVCYNPSIKCHTGNLHSSVTSTTTWDMTNVTHSRKRLHKL